MKLRVKLPPQPCKPDCPRRNGECHGSCKDYKEFREARDEYNRQRYEGRISKWYNNEAAQRSLRKKMNDYKRRH